MVYVFLMDRFSMFYSRRTNKGHPYVCWYLYDAVLAAGSAICFIIYTGSETWALMNTSHLETKVGLLDMVINRLAKVS